jgi:putative nucleotidyltransferase with HDIG domain
MSLDRLFYRFGQFRRHLRSKLAPDELEEVRRMLASAQLDLFLQMSPGEQSHSLEVLHRLSKQGETQQDVRVASLLHDVGKTRAPLRLWERAWIVLAGKLAPGSLRKWGAATGNLGTLPWWQKPCVVAEQHPAWGAEMARVASCSPRVVSLIRRHQENELLNLQAEEDILLSKLQAVDEQS